MLAEKMNWNELRLMLKRGSFGSILQNWVAIMDRAIIQNQEYSSFIKGGNKFH